MRSDRSGIGTGILLITIGLLFMADRQGFMGFHNLWPVIIIVMGLTTIVFPGERPRVAVVTGRRGRRYYRSSRIGGGMWMILVGVLLLANQNHWMSFRDSWPLFVVAGGLALIFGSRGRTSPIVETTDPAAVAGQPGNGNDGLGGGSWR